MDIKVREVKIAVPHSGNVTGLLAMPKGVTAIVTLAHGAGAGMRHKFLENIAQLLYERKIATLRFQFPYMENGSKRPDSAKIATATVSAAVQRARELAPKLPLFAAGKSFGSRMSTTAASEGKLHGVQGIICYGFPLHPPNKPGIERANHLQDVDVPILFLQGTRDALADLELMKKAVRGVKPVPQLEIINGADHSFAVLKSSGRTNQDVLEELADLTKQFVEAFSICAG